MRVYTNTQVAYKLLYLNYFIVFVCLCVCVRVYTRTQTHSLAPIPSADRRSVYVGLLHQVIGLQTCHDFMVQPHGCNMTKKKMISVRVDQDIIETHEGYGRRGWLLSTAAL